MSTFPKPSEPMLPRNCRRSLCRALTRAHASRIETFEKKIETHIVEAGSTLDAFMRDARRTLESAEEFDSSRFFLEALLATTTYETFLGLMMTEARRVKDKRDSKLDTIDEDEEKSGHK